MNKTITIRPMLPEHWNDVANIYRQGIETGMATFETAVPTFEKWNKKYLKTCRLVAVLDEEILGWAALSPVSNRAVYRGIGEVSVYVKSGHRGYKIGENLLQNLIVESEKNGLWTIQSSIMPDNVASIKLHLKLGFRKIGFREKVAQLDGVWKDNILFEKRSSLR